MNAGTPTLTVERVIELGAEDLQALCDTTDAAILDGNGFGWLHPPPRGRLQAFYRGMLIIPERELFVGRLDGVIVASAQLWRPTRNNEAQAFAGTLTSHWVAPWARGHGLARMLLQAVEERAQALGLSHLKLDVRETQEAAIQLYEANGYERWGTLPVYARVGAALVAGYFYVKPLPRKGKPRAG
ncbi:MAG: GNAT family N-acetyltransferase [Alphaproteobacteria bacterium]|nr:GNAT family N-acetyltransferase [Alphaproteobacteria bacterium]